jgi:hypothetical protein
MLNCSICNSNFTNETPEKCGNNHAYHKNCIIQYAVTHPTYYPSDCFPCFVGPLSLVDSNGHCIKCGVEIPYKCPCSINACDRCLPLSQIQPPYCEICEEHHFQSKPRCQLCRTTEVTHINTSKSCYLCDSCIQSQICLQCNKNLETTDYVCRNLHCFHSSLHNLQELLLVYDCPYCNRTRTALDQFLAKRIDTFPKKCSHCNEFNPDYYSNCPKLRYYCQNCIQNEFQRITLDCRCNDCTTVSQQIRTRLFYYCACCCKEIPLANEISCVKELRYCDDCISRPGNIKKMKEFCQCEACKIMFENMAIQCIFCGLKKDNFIVCNQNHVYCEECITKENFERVLGCNECNVLYYEYFGVNCMLCHRRFIATYISHCENQYNYCDDCYKNGKYIQIPNFCKCHNCHQLYGLAVEKRCSICGIKFHPERASDCINDNNYCYGCFQNELYCKIKEICTCPYCTSLYNEYGYKTCAICQSKFRLELYYLSKCDKRNYYCDPCRSFKNYDKILSFCYCVSCQNLHKTLKNDFYTCAICNKNTDRDFELSCENGFYYCGNCRMNPKNIPNTCNCAACDEIYNMLELEFGHFIPPIDRSPHVSADERRRLSDNALLKPNAICLTCGNLNNVIALKCNHNICKTCINSSYYSLLQGVVKNIHDGQFKKVSLKMQYKCLMEGCQIPVRIPVQNFISVLAEYDPWLKGYLELFRPYFDGVRCQFARCICGRTVGVIGKMKLNCNCGSRY